MYPLMKRKGLLTNKYTLSALILLAIVVGDVIIHRGISRVMLPASFTSQRHPVTDYLRCRQTVEYGTHWAKAINNLAIADHLDSSINGIEMDVYFDARQKIFFAYHDSVHLSNIRVEDILTRLQHKDKSFTYWFDFKNLDSLNEAMALQALLSIKNKYQLEHKVIIESAQIHCLQSFCDAGFFTSYYVPFFNPYTEDEPAIIQYIDSIAHQIKKYKVSALSGYYFQMPLFEKFFPGMPLLTWADNSNYSIIGLAFKHQLQKDAEIKIVLYPHVN